MPKAQITWLKYGTKIMEEVAVIMTEEGGGASMHMYKFPGEIGKLAEDLCSKGIESVECSDMDKEKEAYIKDEIEKRRKL